ncbi:sushi domain-containing protein 1 isoform X9 [Lepidochelys kempii]|uniref:sushi domain-containing protein 1 isoform X9 n=1 Tax=Lepidochelys kempii TaxID=8472 RepID=UPI003C6F7549
MSPPGTAAGGGLAARRPRRLRLPLLWLLLWLHAARPAQGQRAATNSSVPDVCATCHANATCQQKEGKNVCICNYGFVGNGRTHCQDKDECQIGASKICGEHTSCHNTHGSFYCICLEGYHPSNNNKIFIPNDGTYCTDIDECQVSGLCGVGGRCVNTVGSYSCYCMEGYRPENGTEFFHPAGNTVSCKAVDCGVPPSVLNAHSAPLRRTTYGSEVAYICLHGYVMESGNQTAVCNAKGQWEGADLVCKEIDCGRPLWIPHAEMIWDNSTTLGSMVYYKCSEGFHFSGKKNFSQCTIIQKWENIAGACEVTDCGRPPSIPNTDMIWNNISQLGSSVHYQCKKGFRSINGRNTSRCIYNGSWEIPAIICKEVDCGIPPPIQHAELMSNPSSSPGSVVQYSCQKGFEYAGGNNISVCTEEGVWVKSTLTCTVKAAIGNVSIFNKTCVKWRRSTRETNLKMVYLFHIQGRRWHQEAFFHEAVFNFTAEEETPELCLDLQAGMNYTVNITVVSPEPSRPVTVTIKTVEEEGFGNVSVFNDTCLKWRRRSGRIGVKETYLFHIQEQQGYLLKSSHETMINFTTEKENPEVCLPLPLGVNYTLTITEASTKLVLQIPITLPATEEELLSNVSIFNETCVKWQRKVARAGTKETYTFRILGRRWYQKEFSREMIFNFTTGEETPEVCLELNSGANYMVNITTASSKGTSALITIAIKTEDPPFPEIEFVTVHGPVPALSLRKAEDRNGPISFYQVIVLPLALQSTFTCDSLAAVTFFSNATEGYVAAEFLAKDVADNMLISLGDRHYYGAFYNAPLKQGKDYCVVLRIISQWNKVRTQSCAVWAQIEDLSPTLQHMTLAGLGSVTAICLILFLSFLAARSYLHSTVQVPPAALAKGVSYETTMDAAGVGIASSFLEIESVSLL